MNQTIADDVFEAMEKFGIDRMNVDFLVKENMRLKEINIELLEALNNIIEGGE